MSLSSGSAGNCYYLGDDLPGKAHHGLLIDAGVSVRALKLAFQRAGLDLDSFGAILVTHDHWDHVRNLGSYAKRLGKPIWATKKLHSAFLQREFCYPYMSACRRDLEEGKWNEVCGFMVRYFEVPHDATQTVGYAIAYGDRKFVIMTDIGRMTEEALSFARQAETVVLESNYDDEMLANGPYTEELKRRISQGHGHLSNAECAEAIRAFWHPGLERIFLCHLSENNNTHEKATLSAVGALESLGVSVAGNPAAGVPLSGSAAPSFGTPVSGSSASSFGAPASGSAAPAGGRLLSDVGDLPGAGHTVRLLALPRTSPTPLFDL